jgi:hypothetical protein
LRPATVCGYSKRQRLDLVLNILTNLAYHKREIQVFGGSQLRPNIHIKDMCKAYISLMEAPSDLVNNQVFNVGFENFSVAELASMVKSNIGNDVKIWHFSHIMSNCIIGNQCNIGQNVVISPEVVLGKNVKVQGYEPQCLDYLLNVENILEDDIHIDHNIKVKYIRGNKEHYYYPDIYVKSQNRIIEVKSEYTYNKDTTIINIKLQACRNLGFTTSIYIIDTKGNILSIY